MAAAVYLDWNATTPLRARARQAWVDTQAAFVGNPASVHRYGQRARVEWERLADRCAGLLGARSHELVLTSGGTEAIATAIHAAVANQPGAVVATQVDHSSVLRSAQQHPHVTRLDLAAVDHNGVLEPQALLSLITAETRLVAFQLANNELGTIQDVAHLVATIRANHSQVLVLIDACQGVGKTALSFKDWGSDFVAVAGHKFGAPRGTGLLYVKTGVPLPPLINGGRQQDDRRSGSEDLAGFAAITAALEEVSDAGDEHLQQESTWLEQAWQLIEQQHPTAHWLGRDAPRLGNTMNIAYPGLDGEAIVARLDLSGFCVSRGAACMARSGQPSHVVQALGLGKQLANGAIRMSTGWETTEAEVMAFAEAYCQAIAAMKR